MKKLKKRTKVILICLACLVVLGICTAIIISVFNAKNPSSFTSPTTQEKDIQKRIEESASVFVEGEHYYDDRVEVHLNEAKTIAMIKVYYDWTDPLFNVSSSFDSKTKDFFIKQAQPGMRKVFAQDTLKKLLEVVKDLSDTGITLDVYIYAYKSMDNYGNPEYETVFQGKWTPEQLKKINWKYMTWERIDDSALHVKKSDLFKEYMGD